MSQSFYHFYCGDFSYTIRLDAESFFTWCRLWNNTSLLIWLPSNLAVAAHRLSMPPVPSTLYSGPVIACHQSVTWLRYFSKHCQVWISCFECFQLWSELPSGEHKRRLQTVQKWQVPKVLWLQFLQVSCSSPISPSKCQTFLQSQCSFEVFFFCF
jgi:hypothetical protein